MPVERTAFTVQTFTDGNDREGEASEKGENPLGQERNRCIYRQRHGTDQLQTSDSITGGRVLNSRDCQRRAGLTPRRSRLSVCVCEYKSLFRETELRSALHPPPTKMGPKPGNPGRVALAARDRNLSRHIAEQVLIHR